MNIKVKHKTFGECEIISLDEDYFSIKYGGTIKKFQTKMIKDKDFFIFTTKEYSKVEQLLNEFNEKSILDKVNSVKELLDHGEEETLLLKNSMITINSIQFDTKFIGDPDILISRGIDNKVILFSTFYLQKKYIDIFSSKQMVLSNKDIEYYHFFNIKEGREPLDLNQFQKYFSLGFNKLNNKMDKNNTLIINMGKLNLKTDRISEKIISVFDNKIIICDDSIKLKYMSLFEKQQKVSEKFKLNDDYKIDYSIRNILIVDDVITTETSLDYVYNLIKNKYPNANYMFYSYAKTINLTSIQRANIDQMIDKQNENKEFELMF